MHLLGNKNGWIRDRAQQFIILKDKETAVPALEELVKNNSDPIAQVHALYALEGLHALSFNLLNAVAEKSDAEVVSHTITLMEEFVSIENASLAMRVFQELIAKQNVAIDLYLATTLGTWAKAAPNTFAPLINTLYKRYKDNPLITEALVSGSGQTVKELIPYLQKFSDFENSELNRMLVKNIDRQKENKLNAIYADNVHKMDNRTRGAQIFQQICAACHGLDGNGTEGVAPPFTSLSI